MTKAKLAGALATVLVLVGCDSGSAPAQKTAAAAAPAQVVDESYRQKLLALSPGQRNSVFFKAIAANGGACPEVQRAVFQQDYKDQMMWVADCAITGDWVTSASAVPPISRAEVMP